MPRRHSIVSLGLRSPKYQTKQQPFNVLKGFLELVFIYQQNVQQYEQYVLRPDVHDRVARAGLQLLKPGAGECTRNNLEIFNFAEEYFDNISDEQWPHEGSKRQSKYSTFKRKF